MAKDTKFLDAFARQIKLSIHTIAPAKVVKFHENECKADIQLLFMTVYKDGTKESYGLLEGVPVQFQRFKLNKGQPFPIKINGVTQTAQIEQDLVYTPFLRPGDIVVVGFAERALDNLTNRPFDPEFHRTHSVQDAIVLGVLK
jgi:Phage protein Gp138 N-terminal domain